MAFQFEKSSQDSEKKPFVSSFSDIGPSDFVSIFRGRSSLSDDEFSSYLTKQRESILNQRSQPRDRTPTFFEMRKINAGESVDLSPTKSPFGEQNTYDSSKLDLPSSKQKGPTGMKKFTSRLSLEDIRPDKQIASQILRATPEMRQQANKDLLKTILIGGKGSRDKRTINPDDVPAVTGEH